jgi:two-component system, NtrC family, nitrogen regulation response regulator GlnG
MARLLIIDDETSICWGLEKLAKQLGHEPHIAGSAEQGLTLAREYGADAVLVDVRLPGKDGLEAIADLRGVLGDVPMIVMTAYGDLGTAVEAVRRGSFEYVVKPFDLQQIERVIGRALESRDEASHPEPPTPPESIDGLIGHCAVMQEVFKRIALAASSQACVLLHGESGVGKELVAQAIHRYSRRSDGPFVAVNVAALNPSLAESELFGHVRGAFTGAESARTGLLVQADGGTLFLDEVADIPLPVQVKLLRALEHGEVTPVGANAGVRTDFRLISASHQNLTEKVRQGTFRHDRYDRLCTFLIDLPPLRRRGSDIEELAHYFMAQLASPERRGSVRLAAETLRELQRRPWHGNVRELRNVIEHALIVAREGLILPEHLPAPLADFTQQAAAADSPEAQLRSLLDQWTRQQLAAGETPQGLYEDFLRLVEPPLLAAAIETHRGQCASAARVLGIHRTTLKKKLDQYGIEGKE